MAKKTTKKNKPAKKKSEIKRVPWTDEERQEQIIFFSKRAMNGSGGPLDELMQGQIDRAQKRLDELRAAKGAK